MACPWAQSKGLQIDKDMRLLGERDRELILTPIFRLHSHSSPASHSACFASSTLSLSGQSSAGAAFNPEGCHNFICWRRRLLLLLLLPLPMASSSAPAAAALGCKGLMGALEVGGGREWGAAERD